MRIWLNKCWIFVFLHDIYTPPYCSLKIWHCLNFGSHHLIPSSRVLSVQSLPLFPFKPTLYLYPSLSLSLSLYIYIYIYIYKYIYIYIYLYVSLCLSLFLSLSLSIYLQYLPLSLVLSLYLSFSLPSLSSLSLYCLSQIPYVDNSSPFPRF